MPSSLQVRFNRRPSTLGCHLRAFYPSPGLREGGVPPIRATWSQHRVDPRHLSRFLSLTGLSAEQGLPLLYPQVFAFPLQMVVLTHRAFPVPIWGILQIRNHLVGHRPIPTDALLDLEISVAGQRVLEKGVEVDLRTTIHSRGGEVWEGTSTFYFRGRFGQADPPSPLSRAPEVGEAPLASWHMPAGAGWRFAGLTGDYNGIHWARWYARRLGFRTSLHHPQRVLGQCMARLPSLGNGQPQRLDAWLKGPVYYGSDVSLRGSLVEGGATFALFADGDARPAIVGRWRSGEAAS